MSDPRTESEALRAWHATLRHADGGWPYYAGRHSRLEPTCWAALALGLDAADTPLPHWPRHEGLVVEPATGVPNIAFNGLAAVVFGQAAVPPALTDGITRALVDIRGVTLPPNPAVRQDASLQAWPWMAGTFSWVEPTAWCLLALKKQHRRVPSADAARRIEEAERLLADRACPDGGWNYGNGEVLGQRLPAHVPTTATALIALQDRAAVPHVRRAADWVAVQAPREGSATALALSWLALRALRRDAREVGAALAGTAARAQTFGNAAAAAMLLVALDSHARGDLPEALGLS